MEDLPVSAANPFELTVTDIGENIRHRSCNRRFYLKVHYDREVRHHLPFFDRLLNTLDPVLSEVGREREDQWETELRSNSFTDLAESLPKGERGEVSWSDFAVKLSTRPPGQQAYGRQVEVEGVIGAFWVSGVIDFVLLRWLEGVPHLALVECKASRRDRTYHRVQVAVYRMLLREM